MIRRRPCDFVNVPAAATVQQVAAERTSTVKSNYSVRLCRWLTVVYGSVQKVWC